MERYQFTDTQLALIEQIPVPLAVYQFLEKHVTAVAFSNGFLELSGYPDRESAYNAMNHDMYRDTHPDDIARVADAALRFALEETADYEVIYRSRSFGGTEYHMIHAIGKHVTTDTGVKLAYVWYIDEGLYEENNSSGIEFRGSLYNALHEESLLKESRYDFLTGLPSMTYFFDLAEEARNAMLRKNEFPVLLYMDLGGMKFFNTHYGFAEGDKLLRAFAGLLADMFGNEHCSHFGADHFVVVTSDSYLEDQLSLLFEKCGKLNGGVTLPVRVGVYRFKEETVHVSTACDRAKIACDTIRHSFTSCFHYYSQDLQDDVESRQYILENLDKAIKEKWIQVYSQPIVRAVNGLVCDEEALSRWIDPVKGFLSPADYIPALEDAGIIYKLDLYVLEEVLAKMEVLRERGIFLVPQSINLSRSDFSSCDIVEEIRSRVDASGLGRHMINIEITESIIGSDFDFMKLQVERFRELGFQVWMDDFGSGYSTLDVLHSIHFDLIKLDMSFLQRLDEGNSGKVILTELVKMATVLGLDTVCEGVETEEQAEFLREIGCAKLQGYYFTKPISLADLLKRYETGTQIGFEDPEESGYFETIGRVSLFDLAVVADTQEDVLHSFMDALPIGIVELSGDRVRYVRSNQAYREFTKRYLGFEIEDEKQTFPAAPAGAGAAFMKVVTQCCLNGGRSFFDEKLGDGAIVHSFVKRLSRNPKTGVTATAVAVLSISESASGANYASITRPLSPVGSAHRYPLTQEEQADAAKGC